MSAYTREEIISILQSVIDGDKSLLEWDDLVSIVHKEPFAAYWSLRCREIEERFGDHSSGQMINEEGVEELKKLRDLLLRMNSSCSEDPIPD